MTKDKEDKATDLKNNFLYDKRVASRNVAKKLMTEQEYKKFLSGLKDETQDCERINLEDEDY